MSSIYAFNIMVEAKTRVIVQMAKKYHPDWSLKQIEDFLKDAIEYAIKKEVIR